MKVLRCKKVIAIILTVFFVLGTVMNTSVLAAEAAVQAAQVPISAARSVPIGTLVTVEGYITGSQASGTAFMQAPDASGPDDGILVQIQNAADFIGQRVSVTGYVRNIMGHLRINGNNNDNVRGVNFTVINPAVTPIAPVPITLEQALTGFQGMLISLTEPVQIGTRTGGIGPQNQTLVETRAVLRINMNTPAGVFNDIQSGTWVNVNRAHVHNWGFDTATELRIYSTAFGEDDIIAMTGINNANRISIAHPPQPITPSPAAGHEFAYDATADVELASPTTNAIILYRINPADADAPWQQAVGNPATISLAPEDFGPTAVIESKARILPGLDSAPAVFTFTQAEPPAVYTLTVTVNNQLAAHNVSFYGTPTPSIIRNEPNGNIWTLTSIDEPLVGTITAVSEPLDPVHVDVDADSYNAERQGFATLSFLPFTGYVTNFAQLQAAIATAPAKTSTTVTLAQSFSAAYSGQSIVIPKEVSIVLTSNTAGPHVFTQGNWDQRHFFVEGSLRLENVILAGGGGSNDTNARWGGIVVRDGGQLYMAQGSTVRDCRAHGVGPYWHGAGVHVMPGGTFTMTGGVITHNHTTGNGGGVYIAGEFNMIGGEISGNTADGNGPQVYPPLECNLPYETLTITSPATFTTVAGQQGILQLTLSTTPSAFIVFLVENAPDGVMVNVNNELLIPDTIPAGEYQFIIIAAGDGITVTQIFTLTVEALPPETCCVNYPDCKCTGQNIFVPPQPPPQIPVILPQTPVMAQPYPAHFYIPWAPRLPLQQQPAYAAVQDDEVPVADIYCMAYEEIYEEVYEKEVQEIAPPVLSVNTLIFTAGNLEYMRNNQTGISVGEPFIDSATNRMMVPLKTLAEALGIEVEWNRATRSVLVHLPAGILVIPADEMLPDNMGAATVVDDRIFIPLRFVMYALDANVRWDSTNRAAVITWCS
ncbi:MAG: stalk domain-containing protein [Firmicutes bacterium]|nr:stalk domain-containing protein [Bacillota bacterium]